MTTWDCPYCGDPLTADPHHAGRRVDCPNCRAMLVVPDGRPHFVQPPGDGEPDYVQEYFRREIAWQDAKGGCGCFLMLIAGMGMLSWVVQLLSR
jgi:hypothetical protein